MLSETVPALLSMKEQLSKYYKDEYDRSVAAAAAASAPAEEYHAIPSAAAALPPAPEASPVLTKEPSLSERFAKLGIITVCCSISVCTCILFVSLLSSACDSLNHGLKFTPASMRTANNTVCLLHMAWTKSLREMN